MSTELAVLLGLGSGVLTALAPLGVFIVAIISYNRRRSKGLLVIAVSQLFAFIFRSIYLLFNLFISPGIFASVESPLETMVLSNMFTAANNIATLVVVVILGIGVAMIGNELVEQKYSQDY